MAEVSAHDAAMIAKVDANSAVVDQSQPTPLGTAPPGTPAPLAEGAKRPDNVPEKFWDAATGKVNTEALLASYVELEKVKPGTPAAGDKPPEGTPDPAAAAITAAKLDAGALSQEWAATGSLSAESYKALETAGFGKDIVDTYIAGQVALANERDNKGFVLAGGKESFDKMASWAVSALTPAEVEVLNAGLAGNEAQMTQSITALKARYEASFGKDPVLTQGNASGTLSGEQPFESRAQVTEAMRDPKYRADPAYRAMVERRIGLMQVF
jgi:hypothetical protein